MKIGFLITLSNQDVEYLMNYKSNSGKQSFLLDLISYYEKADHEVFVITFSDIHGDIVVQHNKTKVYILKRLNHGRVRAMINFSHEINKVKKVLVKEEYDVLHAHWCYEMAHAAIEVNRDRTIITLHDWPDTVCPLIGNYYWKKRQKLGNIVLKNGKNFTAVSPYIMETYLKHHFGNIVCVPNYIDKSISVPCNEIEIRADRFKIISINNGFDNRKNVKKLIVAFSKVKRKLVNSELHLFGSGYEVRGAAYTWAAENNLLDGIVFEGTKSRNDVISALRNSDLLVHPSIEESFGMTLIEAMVNGVAVVAGDKSGAVPWVLGHGEYGVLTNIHNEDVMANSIINILEDFETRKVLVYKSYNYALKTFSIESVAEQYLDLYKTVRGVK